MFWSSSFWKIWGYYHHSEKYEVGAKSEYYYFLINNLNSKPIRKEHILIIFYPCKSKKISLKPSIPRKFGGWRSAIGGGGKGWTQALWSGSRMFVARDGNGANPSE